MTIESDSFADSWHVGRTWLCTLTVARTSPHGSLHAVIDWVPDVPARPLTEVELHDYRAGRDLAIAKVASRLGVTVALVEL